MSKNVEKKFGIAVKAVIKKGDKYLVIKKSKGENIAPDSFDIPGGRLEFNEEPEKALIREVKEETKLSIKIKMPINVWTFNPEKDFQLVGVTYVCEYVSGNVKLSGEHKSFEWLSIKELKAQKYPSWFLKEFECAESVKKLL
ncbi:MAG: NUDIX hydrolase [Candidatus Woesearchaeota archaeon]